MACETETKFPLTDCVYNLMTVIHAKSKALEAYCHYKEDATSPETVELYKKMAEQDRAAIVEMTEKLRCALNKEFEACDKNGSSAKQKETAAVR
jgi:hypothetical protein